MDTLICKLSTFAETEASFFAKLVAAVEATVGNLG